MRIINDGVKTTKDIKLYCKCGCIFYANENDIETQAIPILYEKGIKKFFKMTKSYKYNRYITCPNCYRKIKITFAADNEMNEDVTKKDEIIIEEK